MLNAGERLGNTLMELKTHYKIDFEEVAKFIDIGYPMLTRYRKMKRFSPTVMHKIRFLEEMKIRDNFRLNAQHYEDESEPRWVPAKEEQEITLEDLMGEFERITTLLEKYVELNTKIYEKVTQNLGNNKE